MSYFQFLTKRLRFYYSFYLLKHKIVVTHPSKRKYFKRSRKIFLSHFNSLSPESSDALEVMLQQSNYLATAYYLKEQFYEVMDSASREEAAKKLKKLILSAQISQLKEFKATPDKEPKKRPQYYF